ncbi:hypothetical protein UW576_06570, partial [Streptococcus agalactiae]
DNLSGIEHPVSVKVLNIPEAEFEVVHSLAKRSIIAITFYNLRRNI